MDNNSPLSDKLDGFLKRMKNAVEKGKPGGLIPEITSKLLGGKEPDVGLTSVLQDLFAVGKLPLPLDAILKGDFKPEFGTQTSALLNGILAAAGQPGLALASQAAIAIFKKQIDACGLDKNAEKVSGLPVSKNENGQDVVLYYVEKDAHQVPKLPKVRKVAGEVGSEFNAISALRKGFLNWAVKLDLDVVPVGRQEKANLIVTGEHFGNGTSMLAKTDIGPPRGRQLRMVFNLDKDFDMESFESNAAHEFGHALGIFHEDLNMSDQSLVMHGTMLGVRVPATADIQAAENKGWRV